jgi:sensor histidine kinase YesM
MLNFKSAYIKRSFVFTIHIGFWVAYFFLLFVIIAAATQGFSSGPNLGHLIKIGISFVVLPSFFMFYLFYFFLFPKYIQTKKIGLSIVFGALFSIASALVGGLILILLSGIKTLFESGFGFFFSMTLIGLLAGAMSIIIKGFITWYNDIKLKEALTYKNHQMELALVKSQLDPHFLFNTINNIDILILKDAQLASEYLNKLSDILRFMLFETKTEKIPLSKEIETIEKYVELQKIRSSNDSFVNFSVSGNLSNQLISPMLFIPFIENAFKHVSNKKTENAIAISLLIEDKKIRFECENTYNENNKLPMEYNGLGNELIKKRIELMYPEKHNLIIKSQNNSYKVNLEITND